MLLKSTDLEFRLTLLFVGACEFNHYKTQENRIKIKS